MSHDGVSYSAQRPGRDAQPLQLSQSIHELKVKMSSSETKRELQNIGRQKVRRIYDTAASTEECMTIGQRQMVFCRDGQAETNSVFAYLNRMELNPKVAASYDLAKADLQMVVDNKTIVRHFLSNGIAMTSEADIDAQAHRLRYFQCNLLHVIKQSMHFVGVMQAPMAQTAFSLATRLPSRDHGSAVYGGVYDLYNPYPKTIRIFTVVVWDIPSLDQPHKETRMDVRFGFTAVRPFLRPYDATNPFDNAYIVGKTVADFNPQNGSKISIQFCTF